tara:strand:- start:3737 stop:5152 length:1416 start_codon:yes stop_codon:yes gene_type:complete
MAIKDYSTYVPTEGVDWGKITEDLIGNINAVETGRKESYLAVEKEKEALDLIMTDANKLMDKQELYATQNLNDFILNGADSGRKKISEWNKLLKLGQISPKDYKKRINTLNDSWSTLAGSAKGYDAANKELMDRQTPDQTTGLSKGTGLEQYKSQIHAEIGDLKDKKIFYDDQSGNAYIGKMVDGKIVDMTPTIRYAQPSNFFDNTVDIAGMITKGTRTFAEYTIEKGTKTVSDALQNLATANAVGALQSSVLSNNSFTAQVLDNFSGVNVEYYRTEDEKKAKIQVMIDAEVKAREIAGLPVYTDALIKQRKIALDKQLILVQPDDSQIFGPVITDAQKKWAENITLDMIKSQMAIKIEEDEPVVRSSSSGSRGSSTPKEEEVKVDYILPMIQDAWNNKDYTAMRDLLPEYEIYTDSKKPNQWGFKLKSDSKGPINYYKNAKQLSALFGYGAAGNINKWAAFFDNPLGIKK